MTTDHKSVFLSYASEDAEAARRIAEALRAEGLEVWFDQTELRGGDAWDASIRARIRECALFLPIISEHTEARAEGYFRLEWRLAVDRSQLMADDKPFLLPVAIDRTPESSARVPEAFRARQWIRIGDATPNAAIAAQVKRLMSASAARAERPIDAQPADRKAPARISAGGIAAVLLVLVMLVAVAGHYATKTQPAADPTSVPVTKVPAIAVASPNSIAVLPFANLSDDKQNEYFSDGISEELLTVLQKVSALQVAARSSSFTFKGTSATAQEIGQKLGVSYLVEGSVRKAAQTVRITARLSRAATGEQLWSDVYTRDVRDVFAVQAELAQTIVEQLRNRVGTASDAGRAAAQAQLAAAVKGGTRNPESHQLYLQGLYYEHQWSLPATRKASEYLERATKFDPQFALAWAALSRANAQRGGLADTKAEFDAAWANARRAAERAIGIEPSLPSAHLALAQVQIYHDFEWRGASESLAKARAVAPGDDDVIASTAALAHAVGRPETAIRFGEQAVLRDPLSVSRRMILASALASVGRLEDAAAQYRRMAEINAEAPWGHAGVASALLLEKRPQEALTEAARESTDWSRLTVQSQILWSLGKRAESDAALERLVATQAETAALQIAQVYAHRGDNDRAFEWLERAYRQRDAGLGWLKCDAFLSKLAADPRWNDFLRKLGLADDQLKSLPSFEA